MCEFATGMATSCLQWARSHGAPDRVVAGVQERNTVQVQGVSLPPCATRTLAAVPVNGEAPTMGLPGMHTLQAATTAFPQRALHAKFRPFCSG
jgi:hypothetical protein